MTHNFALPARANAQLNASDLHLARGGRPVISGIDLAVSPGTRLGAVGENGRGKSTLLQILSGDLIPDSGTVQRIGTVGKADQEMAMTDQRTVGDVIDVELAEARTALRLLDESATALAQNRPGAENAYADALHAAEILDAWDADRRVDMALAALHAVSDRNRRLAELSVGQRYRIRLACLLGAGYDFLLLDEPTNHLDAAGLRYLSAELIRHPGGVVLVSHDRALLTDVVTTVIDLDPSRDGRPRIYGGGYQGYRAGRDTERQLWADEYKKQQAEHERLSRDLATAQDRLISGWRPDKGTGKHTRATRAPALVRAVNRRRDELVQHAVTMPAPPMRLQAPELPVLPGLVLVQADEVSMAGRLQERVSLELHSGDRLLVNGPNGAGKSTLMSLLAGRSEPSDGVIRTDPNVRVGLLAQESPASSQLHAREVYAARVGRLVTAGRLLEEESVALEELGLLSASDMDKRVRDLSMGQQRRLDLALVLAARPHLLLLDEPTNHLSVTLVDELTQALRATKAAVVVATHDRQLLRDIGDWPILTLTGTRQLTGNVPDR